MEPVLTPEAGTLGAQVGPDSTGPWAPRGPSLLSPPGGCMVSGHLKKIPGHLRKIDFTKTYEGGQFFWARGALVAPGVRGGLGPVGP